MVLGAVVDAGVAIEALNESLAGMKIKGLSLSHESSQRGGVRGTLVSVGYDKRTKRSWQTRDFINVIAESSLSSNVIEHASAVLLRLAEAEGIVHGVPKDEVRLHELGELDTLVDVVGSILGLEMLGIQRLYSSPLPSGSGVVESAHGSLPVPSPVAAAIFTMARAPIIPPPGNVSDAGEMVTPTGAALVTTLATFRQPPMNIERIGYGLGVRESCHYPNVLGLWIGDETEIAYVPDFSLLETNIDDMSPEILAYVQERLFDLGARDVWFTPIQMKKNRPATMLSVLIPTSLESQAVMLMMRETSSLGVRVRSAVRYEAEREVVKVETSLGSVRVKVKRLEGSIVTISPEYEECRRIAIDMDMPLQDVHRIIQNEATERLL